MIRAAFIVCIFISSTINAQTSVNARNIDTVGNASKTVNIYNSPLFGDSLASSFCIVIKKEVKAHKHEHHSEHVIISEGEGIMKIGNNTFPVKKGDVIFIPQNTIHSVKTSGGKPLKVISIQAPLFDGNDRIMIEEK